jgi:flagellar basal-body rod modification protein FlgD
MSGKLQNQLAPISPPNSFDFNKLDVAEKGKVRDAGAEPQVEFRTLLQNSNSDVSRERAAKKTGDLSAAKSDEEFRSMLAEKANPKRSPKNTLGKDDFMKLFIAQMQSQDPLNPQDSSQMAAQMAQFNGLEQMMNVNKTLETMLQSQSTDRAVGMVNYVGKEVDVGAGLLKWEKNKLTKSTFEIDQPLANAFVEVRDSAGQVISQQELGNLMPGDHNLQWDGKLKDGRPANPGVYHFSLLGKSVEGQDVPIPIKSKVKVTGIDLKTDGGAFFTELGKIAIKDVASVGLQGFEDAKAGVNEIEPPPAPVKPTLTTQEPNLEIEIPNENMELPPVDAPNLNPADLMEEAKRAPNAPEEKQVFNPTQPQTRGGEGNLNIPVTVARR